MAVWEMQGGRTSTSRGTESKMGWGGMSEREKDRELTSKREIAHLLTLLCLL